MATPVSFESPSDDTSLQNLWPALSHPMLLAAENAKLYTSTVVHKWNPDVQELSASENLQLSHPSSIE